MLRGGMGRGRRRGPGTLSGEPAAFDRWATEYSYDEQGRVTSRLEYFVANVQRPAANDSQATG